MGFNAASFNLMVKGLCIEGFALGMAFLTDYLIKSIDQSHASVRFSMAVRVFYFSKNVFYLLDSLCITKDNNLRHLFSGTFNVMVGATIYPASAELPILVSQAILFVAGSTARLIVEGCVVKQTVPQHLRFHRGKLLCGAAGVFLSMIPGIGMSAPAFYWSGELYDVWQMRKEGETMASILCEGKSTVPIQAFIAVWVKLSLKLTQHLPFVPVFSIDGIIGLAHQLFIGVLAMSRKRPQSSNKEQPARPAVNAKAIGIEMPDVTIPEATGAIHAVATAADAAVAAAVVVV